MHIAVAAFIAVTFCGSYSRARQPSELLHEQESFVARDAIWGQILDGHGVIIIAGESPDLCVDYTYQILRAEARSAMALLLNPAEPVTAGEGSYAALSDPQMTLATLREKSARVQFVRTDDACQPSIELASEGVILFNGHKSDLNMVSATFDVYRGGSLAEALAEGTVNARHCAALDLVAVGGTANAWRCAPLP